MSGMVDKTGNELNTQGEDDGTATGLPEGDVGETAQQPAERVAEINTKEGYFVIRIPIQNNVYTTLSFLLWAEDKIRGIYAEAQMNKAKSQLVSPVGRMMKTFKNRWS